MTGVILGLRVGEGGGIHNFGTLTVRASTFARNTSDSDARQHPRDAACGTLEASGSTFTGNSTGNAGGGIMNAHQGPIVGC